jgi:RimJ/RimL family protein N-acetyltransferase
MPSTLFVGTSTVSAPDTAFRLAIDPDASVLAWALEESKKKLENDAFRWVIESMKAEAVGSISTHDCNPRNGTFSYGIDVAPEHQRNGYASEAIRLVLKYYFEELRYQKVTVQVHASNPPSRTTEAGFSGGDFVGCSSPRRVRGCCNGMS